MPDKKQDRDLKPTEEQLAILKETKAKHDKRMEEDPAYRAKWESFSKEFAEHAGPLIGDRMD